MCSRLATAESSTPPHLSKVKATTGIGSYYIDLILDDKQKSEGRQQKFIQLKIEKNTREEKVDQLLKKLTKNSSTALAANNHFVLDRIVQDQMRCAPQSIIKI